MPFYGDATQEDLQRWEQYCRVLDGCHAFLQAAVENGIPVQDSNRLNFSETGTQDVIPMAFDMDLESSFIRQGLAVYTEGVNEIVRTSNLPRASAGVCGASR